MNFDRARQVANAVLYEGYLLYPYRASAVKNRFRWQFGIIAPRSYSETGGCEPWEMQTECLIAPEEDPLIEVMVRFLQVQEGGHPGWDEGIERELNLSTVGVRRLLAGERTEPFRVADAILGAVRLTAEEVDSYLKVRVRIENLTPWPEHAQTDRATALRHSLVAAHTLLGLSGGTFISLADPPPEAQNAVAACSNVHTWPVLAGAPGEHHLLLSSPIILYDYPELAPESPGGLCDSTEIDELLTLRIMTLTDEEKQEARLTDERARAIIERSDSIPAEVFERLHGAIRHLGPAAANATEEFLNPAGERRPQEASAQIGGRRIAAGDRVRIQPHRRADSMDLFLAGRVARVEAVHRDLEGRTYIAVALDDESGELSRSYKRFFYFDPDEIQPV